MDTLFCFSISGPVDFHSWFPISGLLDCIGHLTRSYLWFSAQPATCHCTVAHHQTLSEASPEFFLQPFPLLQPSQIPRSQQPSDPVQQLCCGRPLPLTAAAHRCSHLQSLSCSRPWSQSCGKFPCSSSAELSGSIGAGADL